MTSTKYIGMDVHKESISRPGSLNCRLPSPQQHHDIFFGVFLTPV
jgi:hypothetical protein